MRSRTGGATLALLTALGCSREPAAPASAPVPPIVAAGPTKPEGTVAERVEKARPLADSGDLPRAIETLEEGLAIDARDRASLGLLARYLTDRALAVESAGTTEYYTRLVSAAEYYRRLRDLHPDLTEEEKTLGLDVLYAEATAHAKSRRIEETTGSLRDLVAAGFTDFDRMRADPGWEKIFEVPRFRKEFDAIAAAPRAP